MYRTLVRFWDYKHLFNKVKFEIQNISGFLNQTGCKASKWYLSFQCNLKFLESFDSDVIQTECYKDSVFSRNYVEFLLLKRSYY